MTLDFKCFIKFHKHGTILNDLKTSSKLSNRLDNLNDVFEKLKLGLNDARHSYDFGFTFIWKKGIYFL